MPCQMDIYLRRLLTCLEPTGSMSIVERESRNSSDISLLTSRNTFELTTCRAPRRNATPDARYVRALAFRSTEMPTQRYGTLVRWNNRPQLSHTEGLPRSVSCAGPQ